MNHCFPRGIHALAVVLVVATVSCKADRSSGGSVASHETPPPSGSLDTTLSWKGTSFHVTGHDSTFTIQASGANGANRHVEAAVPGLVSRAEIGDLNNDNSPELLVYGTSPDSARRVAVVGFTANANGALDRLDFDGIDDFPQAKPGYAGHDDYKIVNGTLTQTFPLYDDRGQPTGKTRKIQYHLVNGEGSLLLRVNRVSDY